MKKDDFFWSSPERCGCLYLWINHIQNNPNTTGMFVCYFSCYINKKLLYIAESRGGFDFCLCTLVEFLQTSAPCIVFKAMRRVEMSPPTSGSGAWGCGQEQVGLPGWASCVGVGSERLWLSRWHSSLSICSVPAQAELGCIWERGIAPLESSGVPLIANPICEPFMNCFIRQFWESVVMHSLLHQPYLEVPVTKQTNNILAPKLLICLYLIARGELCLSIQRNRGMEHTQLNQLWKQLPPSFSLI